MATHKQLLELLDFVLRLLHCIDSFLFGHDGQEPHTLDLHYIGALETAAQGSIGSQHQKGNLIDDLDSE